MSLTELPDVAINHVISFLPQQALLNLALTNFRFYQPVSAKLYRSIIIQCDPILSEFQASKSATQPKRKSDFLESTHTVIYGLNHAAEKGKVYSLATQLKLVVARLTVLNSSLEINPELVSLIKEIRIENGPTESVNAAFRNDELIVSNIRRLVKNLKGAALDRFYVGDYGLRKLLQINSSGISLKSAVVDDPQDLENNKFREVLLSINEKTNINTVDYETLTKLESLILPSTEVQYWRFMKEALKVVTTGFNFQKFKFHFTLNPEAHGWNVLLARQIRWSSLKELEILVGSKEVENDDYVLDCLNLIPTEELSQLQKISVVQSTEYNTHKKNEQFDIAVFNFLDSIIGNEGCQLQYISITHSLPNTGNFVDGFEGNYMRRYKLFSEFLPRVLDKSRRKIDLALPNLFQSLACYEQSMNTALWNGCKCPHCEKYLGEIDQFLLYHKHYNYKIGAWRDINSSLMMYTMGQFLYERMVSSDSSLSTHLDHESRPLNNRLWNFHDSAFGVPFRCYDVQVVDQGEFDESQGEKPHINQEEDLDEFFDSSENIKPCKYNRALYHHNIPVCIAHYINDLILKMINLNRGNAEELVIGEEFKDGGDDEIHLKISRLIINGICYNLDKELNGTNFFENVYDNV